MSSVQIPLATVGLNSTQEKLKAIDAGMKPALADAIHRAALLVERAVKQGQLSGKQGKTTGLDVGTGQLRASFSSAVFYVGERLVGIVGSPLVYSRIHEEGGTIKPVKAGALTIPLTPEAHIRKARDFDDLFIWKNPDTGKAFLAQGDDAKLTLHYLLMKSVTIPPRRYLTKAMKAAKADVLQLVGKGVSVVISQADAKTKGVKD